MHQNTKDSPMCRTALRKKCAEQEMSLREMWDQEYWNLSRRMQNQLARMLHEEGQDPGSPPPRP